MAQVISLLSIYQLLLVFILFLCHILQELNFLQIFEMRNPMTSQAFIQYMLQLVCQVWFHIFKLVTYQPMFQVRNQAEDKVMGLTAFQSNILSSTRMYYSNKPHMILLVSISVPSLVGMHKPPSVYTTIGCSIQ